MNEVTTQDMRIVQVQQNLELCQILMKTPHYAKMGEGGMLAIIAVAKSLGEDPIVALNGLLYFVNGKVEMSARGMNSRIRKAGHSVLVDPKSDHKICILHGKRADNGDTCTAQFTIGEAERIGLTKSGAWKNYPEDMLFCRALSRLGRRLFPDLIGECYVEGEIDDKRLNDPKYTISEEEAAELQKLRDEKDAREKDEKDRRDAETLLKLSADMRVKFGLLDDPHLDSFLEDHKERLLKHENPLDNFDVDKFPEYYRKWVAKKFPTTVESA